MPFKYQCKFQKEWLHESSPFTNWLERGKTDCDAWCKLCKKSINISTMGVGSLKSHTKSGKHIKVVKERDTCIGLPHFFGKQSSGDVEANIIRTSNSVPSISSSVSSTTVEQPATSLDTSQQMLSSNNVMKKYIINESVTEAEILWCMNNVVSHSSKRSGGEASSLFSRMFADSQIAQKFSAAKDKIRYMINHGIAPYYEEHLLKKIDKCDFFVALFDESLNKIAQKGQMDIHIRFLDDQNIKTRYLTSVFLGRARAEDLLEAFNNGTQTLDHAKMLQVSMDGPNVNHKFYKLLKECRSSDAQLLLDCGTCSLHVLCGSIKTADEKSNLNVGKLLICLYCIFKDSPMRRSLLLVANDITESEFPLKFCATRWVENSRVATRAMLLLPRVKRYVEKVTAEKNEPTCQSYKHLKSALDDPLLSAKVAVFKSVAFDLEEFLVCYQTDAPMVPFLYDTLYELLKGLMEHVVKKEILDGITVMKMLKIDLTNEKNLKPAEEISLGFAVKDEIRKHRDSVSNKQILEFRKQCSTFYVSVIKKIIERCPLKYNMIKGATFLNPAVMTSNQNAARINIALECFVTNNVITGTEADKIKKEYERLCSNANVKKALMNYKSGTRLDSFLLPLLKELDSSLEFTNFVARILCLSHGQASVERGFNINKELLVENQKEASLIAQRVVYDAIRSSDVPLKDIEIPKSLILSARNSHQRYKEALNKAKELKKTEDTASEKKRRTNAIIKAKEEKLKKIKLSHQLELDGINEEIENLRK